MDARRKSERRESLIAEQEARDGHMTKAERAERMRQVMGYCGADKACMKSLLGQEHWGDEQMVRF